MGLGNNVLLELVVVILTWAKTLPALQQIEWMNMSLRKNLTYIIFRNGETLHRSTFRLKLNLLMIIGTFHFLCAFRYYFWAPARF